MPGASVIDSGRTLLRTRPGGLIFAARTLLLALTEAEC